MMSSAIDDWIAREAISFTLDPAESLDVAVDRMVASLGDGVDLLGIGEPTHGVEEFLVLRNRVFQRLVERHGFSAIAVESSFPRGRAANDYVLGCGGSTSYEDVQERGFSHGFGRMAANRELVEWMRTYNAEAPHSTKLQFYGFDSPTEMTGADSPRELLTFAVEYLAAIDAEGAARHLDAFDPLLGDDAAWSNPAASFDPAKAIGGSPNAIALRVATEDFIGELEARRPELIAKSDEARYAEAVRYAIHARQMLTYHAALARPSDNRIAELLGIRDAMMADNLAYIMRRERGRANSPRPGRVLAFAHNSHLKVGRAEWQWGPTLLRWWPAGAHVRAMMGPRYVVIGVGVGVSKSLGIGEPEAGTLEARLMAAPGPGRFIATHGGARLSPPELESVPARAGTQAYFPFTTQSLSDFDYLALLDSVG